MDISSKSWSSEANQNTGTKLFLGQHGGHYETSKISFLEDHQKKRIEIIVERLYNKINSISLIVFICTHNSRRSQFCEAWSKVLANRYGLNISFSSAGTTKTSVYKEVINSLKRAGVDINEKGLSLIHI